MKNFERVDVRPAYDEHGKIVHMVTSGGYVMVKRPYCAQSRSSRTRMRSSNAPR